MRVSDKKPLSFQDLILTLHAYWSKQGCVILQPYDMRVGAGTFHPATTLRALGPDRWNCAFVQPSRRPTDGRYGDNPNRLQHYYQYQVIMKPSPPDLRPNDRLRGCRNDLKEMASSRRRPPDRSACSRYSRDRCVS